MKIITRKTIEEICTQASDNERLRMNFNLHDSLDESVHKLLNALQPGTVMPVHRHLHPPKKETFVLLQGALELKFYNDAKEVTRRFLLSETGDNLIAEIMPEEWHSFEVLEPDTVILEIKPGPYLPFQPVDLL